MDALTAWTITLFSEPDIRFLNRRRKRLVHYKERRHTIPDFLIRLPQTLNHRVYPILAKRNAAWPQWIKHQGLLVYLPGTLDFILAQACQKALAFHLKQLGRAA